MIYPIVAYGDPVLRKIAQDVTAENLKNLPEFTQDLFETMHNAGGIGLAAPQIGKSLRIFVVDGNGSEDEELEGFKQVFVNPKMLEEFEEPWAYEEGCLSIPSIRENVKRNAKIRIHFFDENWNEFEEEFEGMQARVIQHEYDHIEGILFTDHLTPLKKRLLKGKLNNIAKERSPPITKCDSRNCPKRKDVKKYEIKQKWYIQKKRF